MGQIQMAVEDDFLTEVAPEEEVGAEIVFESPAQIDYQIQKIARLKKQQDEVKLFVKKQFEDLGKYLEERLSILQKKMDWLAQPLEIYIRDAYRRTEGRMKSLTLPHGKLKLRMQQDKFIYDEPAILSWAKADPSLAERFIEIKESIRKDQIKNYTKETGEIPLGVTIEPAGEPAFYLVLKEDEGGGGGNGE
jgi:hypothetical protein